MAPMIVAQPDQELSGFGDILHCVSTCIETRRSTQRLWATFDKCLQIATVAEYGRSGPASSQQCRRHSSQGPSIRSSAETGRATGSRNALKEWHRASGTGCRTVSSSATMALKWPAGHTPRSVRIWPTGFRGWSRGAGWAQRAGCTVRSNARTGGRSRRRRVTPAREACSGCSISNSRTVTSCC